MTWILTHTGKKVYFNEPEKSEFDIVDIAHALSLICRFTGHVEKFYSVAQHSVIASYLVPPQQALGALMHDSAEAYIGDVSTPLKQMLPEYKVIEKRMEHAIRTHFGLPPELHPDIHHADLRMLATEKRDMLPEHPEPWPCLIGILPMEVRIKQWSPTEAQDNFMRRFNQLYHPGCANKLEK